MADMNPVSLAQGFLMDVAAGMVDMNDPAMRRRARDLSRGLEPYRTDERHSVTLRRDHLVQLLLAAGRSRQVGSARTRLLAASIATSVGIDLPEEDRKSQVEGT